MNRMILKSLPIASLALVMSQAASAADLDQIIYAPELKRTVPVEIGNGWYLRGDIGYAFEQDGSSPDFDESEIDSDFSVGGGVGYQFTEFLRTDLTADYHPGDFNGATAAAGLCAAGPCASGAEFDAIGLMANAYVDLGTFVGVTPYLGAGVGYTFVNYSDLTADDGATVTTYAGESDWRFSYALMAGLSYDLSKSMKLDFGYRYLDVDGGATYAGGSDDDGFSKHEVRAGFRYSLW